MFIELPNKLLASGKQIDIFASVIDSSVSWYRAYDPIQKKDLSLSAADQDEIEDLVLAEKLLLDGQRADYLTAILASANSFNNSLSTYSKHIEVQASLELKQSLANFIQKVGG